MAAGHYAQGRKAWGICGRCGQRDSLANLGFDGYFPALRVHERCYDARHPQDRPLSVTDPVALWRPSPEDYPIEPPVLTAEEGSVVLEWTRAVSYHVRIETYALYKAIADGDAVLLQTFTNEYSYDGELLEDTLTYTDEDVDPAQTYHYYVVAAASNPRFSANSNIASITLSADDPPGPPVLSGEFLDPPDPQALSLNAGAGAIGDVGFFGYATALYTGSGQVGTFTGTDFFGWTVIAFYSEFFFSEYQGFVLVLQGVDETPPDRVFSQVTVETDDGDVTLEALDALISTEGLPAFSKMWRWSSNVPFSESLDYAGTVTEDVSVAATVSITMTASNVVPGYSQQAPATGLEAGSITGSLGNMGGGGLEIYDISDTDSFEPGFFLSILGASQDQRSFDRISFTDDADVAFDLDVSASLEDPASLWTYANGGEFAGQSWVWYEEVPVFTDGQQTEFTFEYRLDGDRASLTWTAAQAGSLPIADYQLYRAVDEGDFELLTTVDAADPREYIDADIQRGTLYSYRVRARDTAEAEGEFSNVVQLIQSCAIYSMNETMSVAPPTVTESGAGNNLDMDLTAQILSDGNENRLIVIAFTSDVTFLGEGALDSATLGNIDPDSIISGIGGGGYSMTLMSWFLDTNEFDDFILRLGFLGGHDFINGSAQIHHFGNVGSIYQTKSGSNEILNGSAGTVEIVGDDLTGQAESMLLFTFGMIAPVPRADVGTTTIAVSAPADVANVAARIVQEDQFEAEEDAVAQGAWRIGEGFDFETTEVDFAVPTQGDYDLVAINLVALSTCDS